MRIDLHAHSTVSDGTEPPAVVVEQAAAAGLDVVALTDHDSVEGWAEASAAATRVGIELVPGIEVSCRHHGISIHMLAYWPDPHDDALVGTLAKTRDARVARAQAMVARIGVDYPVTWDDVLAESPDAATVGRPHIADALITRGHFARREDAFELVLSNHSPYYVPHYAPEVVEAVVALRHAGGVPVFAHPGADARGRVVPDAVIEQLADAGLVGIEVEHRDHSPAQRERLSGIAARLGLVPTGSSDYHGAGKPNRLGENLTSPENYAALQAARA